MTRTMRRGPGRVHILIRGRGCLFISGPCKVLAVNPSKLRRILHTRLGSSGLHTIRELSGSASNYLLITHSSRTFSTTISVFGAHHIGGLCSFLTIKHVRGGPAAVAAPVRKRPTGAAVHHRTCGRSTAFNSTHVRAKHARRVHLRLTSVHRPIIKSELRNLGGDASPHFVEIPHRVLRTARVRLSSPVKHKRLETRDPLPTSFHHYLRVFNL